MQMKNTIKVLLLALVGAWVGSASAEDVNYWAYADLAAGAEVATLPEGVSRNGDRLYLSRTNTVGAAVFDFAELDDLPVKNRAITFTEGEIAVEGFTVEGTSNYCFYSADYAGGGEATTLKATGDKSLFNIYGPAASFYGLKLVGRAGALMVPEYGGAICARDNDGIYIEGCSFKDFEVDYSGGAICTLTLCDGDESSVTITNTLFENCSAGFNGGAIAAEDELAIHAGSVFRGNEAGVAGGAIFADNVSGYTQDVAIDHTAFLANDVDNLGSGDGYGGAIAIGNGQLKVFASIFSNNTVTAANGEPYGGAIEGLENAYLEIFNTTISGSNGGQIDIASQTDESLIGLSIGNSIVVGATDEYGDIVAYKTTTMVAATAYGSVDVSSGYSIGWDGNLENQTTDIFRTGTLVPLVNTPAAWSGSAAYGKKSTDYENAAYGYHGWYSMGAYQLQDYGPVTVTIRGNSATNVYDGAEHEISGWAFESDNAIYTENFFTFSGNSNAVRTVVGATKMGLAESQFSNTNTAFSSVTFVVTDGEQAILPIADEITVTITGNRATNVYDAVEHSVSGWTFASSNPLYLERYFTFSGVSNATRKAVGVTTFGMKTSEFSNTNDNFTTVKFTVFDGEQVIIAAEIDVDVADPVDPTKGDPDDPTKPTVDPTLDPTDPGYDPHPRKGPFAPNDPQALTNAALVYSQYDCSAIYDGAAHTIDVDALTNKYNSLVTSATNLKFEYAASSNATEWLDAPYTLTDYGATSIWYRVTDPAGNYDPIYHLAKIVIGKRPVTLTSGDQTFTYDGNAHSNLTVTVGGERFVEGEGVASNNFATIVNVTESPVENTFEIAFDETTTKSANYDVTFVWGELTVVTEAIDPKEGDEEDPTDPENPEDSKVDPTVDPTDPGYPADPVKGPFAPNDPVALTNAALVYSQYDYSAIYDGAAHTIDVDALTSKYNSLVTEATHLKFEYAASSNATDWLDAPYTLTDYGATSIWYRVTDPAGNYDPIYHLAKIVIGKRPVTLTSGDETFTYDGNAHSNLTVTVGGERFVEGEGVASNNFATITNVKQSPVTNTFEIAFDEVTTKEANYDVTYVWGKLTVVTEAIDPKEGDEEDPTTSEDPNDPTVDPTLDPTDPGYNPDPAKGPFAPNDPIALTNAALVYSQYDYSAIYDGAAHTIDVDSLTNKYNSIVTSATHLKFEYAASSNATEWLDAPYTLTDYGATSIWYRVTDPAGNYDPIYHLAKIVIGKRPVTLTSGDETFTYDGNAHSNLTVTVGGELFVAGEGVASNNFATIVNVTESPVTNTFEITFDETTTKEANYDVTFVWGELKVETEAIDPKAGDEEDPTDPENPDDPKVDPTVDPSVEPYPADPVKGPFAPNDPQALTNAALVYSQYDYSAIYDGAAHTIDVDALTNKYNSLVTSATHLKFEYAASSNATEWLTSPYTLTDYGATSIWYRVTDPAGNYDPIYHLAKIVIGKRPVTLTSGDETFTYDGNAHSNLTITVGGELFVEGEGVASNNFATIVNVTESPVANTFEIVFDEVTTKSANYDVTFVWGELKVETEAIDPKEGDEEDPTDPENPEDPKVDPTLDPTDPGYNPDPEKGPFAPNDPVALTNAALVYSQYDYTNIYDGAAHTIDVDSLTNKYNSLVTSATNFKFEYAASSNATEWLDAPYTLTDYGATSIWYRVTDPAGNYDPIYHLAKIVIGKRPLTLTSANGSWTYDGEAHSTNEIIVTGSGWAEGEGASYSDFPTITEFGSKSNTYVYQLNEDTAADNYDIAVVYGTIAITAIPGAVNVTITGNRATNVYDAAKHSVSGWTFASSNPLYLERYFTFSGVSNATRKAVGVTTFGMKASDFKNVNADFKTVNFIVLDGEQTITAAKIDADADPVDPTKTDPDDPTKPTLDPTLDPTVPGYDPDPVKGPFAPNDLQALTNAVLVYSEFDYTNIYDGVAHTIDTNALVEAYTATALTGTTFKFEYATSENGPWSNAPVSLTDCGATSIWYRVSDPAGNYDPICHLAKIVIDKKSLTLTADSKHVYFGDAVPELTISYDGFVEGEGPEKAFSVPPVLTTTYTPMSADGVYPVTFAVEAEAKNYELTHLPGKIYCGNGWNVAYNANGGKGVMASEEFSPAFETNLTAVAFTKDGYNFYGWALEKTDDIHKSKFGDGQAMYQTWEPGVTKTLYATWTKNIVLAGKIDGTNGVPRIVRLVPVGETNVVCEGDVCYGGTDPYQYALEIPSKTAYNVIFEFDKPDPEKSEVTNTVKVTVFVDYTDYDPVNPPPAPPIVIPEGDWNSEVDNTEAGDRKAVASGLDEIATSTVTNAEGEEVPSNPTDSIKVILTVTDKPVEKLDEGKGEPETRQAICTSAGNYVVEAFDLSLMKNVKARGEEEYTTNEIKKLDKEIEVVVPFKLEGRTNFKLYQNVNGTAEEVPDYAFKTNANQVVMKVKDFGMYAFAYQGAQIAATEPTKSEPVALSWRFQSGAWYATVHLKNTDGWANTVQNLKFKFPDRMNGNSTYATLILPSTLKSAGGEIALNNRFMKQDGIDPDVHTWGVPDDQTGLIDRQSVEIAVFTRDGKMPSATTIDDLVAQISYESYGWTNAVNLVAKQSAQTALTSMSVSNPGTSPLLTAKSLSAFNTSLAVGATVTEDSNAYCELKDFSVDDGTIRGKVEVGAGAVKGALGANASVTLYGASDLSGVFVSLGTVACDADGAFTCTPRDNLKFFKVKINVEEIVK